MKRKESFTSRVLDVVRSIPRGKVMTYKEVAQKAGSPHAARAVGSILRKNYDPRIPCHRVVRSSGGVGFYNRGGEREKERLLREEGVDLSVLTKKKLFR